MGLSSFDLKDYMTNTAIKIMYERNFINMHLEQMDILGVHNNVYIKGSFDRLVYFYDELKKALGRSNDYWNDMFLLTEQCTNPYDPKYSRNDGVCERISNFVLFYEWATGDPFIVIADEYFKREIPIKSTAKKEITIGGKLIQYTEFSFTCPRCEKEEHIDVLHLDTYRSLPPTYDTRLYDENLLNWYFK